MTYLGILLFAGINKLHLPLCRQLSASHLVLDILNTNRTNNKSVESHPVPSTSRWPAPGWTYAPGRKMFILVSHEDPRECEVISSADKGPKTTDKDCRSGADRAQGLQEREYGCHRGLYQRQVRKQGMPCVHFCKHGGTDQSRQVIQNIGLCISLYDLLWASEGLIGHGNGLVNVNGPSQTAQPLSRRMPD